MGIVIWSSAEKTYFNQTIQTVLSQLQMRYTLCQDMSKFPPVSNGDIVLSCGSKALTVLQVLGVVPKNRSIASLRGKQFSHFGAKVFVTYDPMIVNRDYGRMPDIQWDTQLAARLAVTGSLEPVYGDYRYVESLHELIEKVEEKYAKTGKPVEVACDLETKGLVPYDDKVWIITCQFTVEKGKSDVLYFEFGEKPVAPLPWKNEEEWTYWEGLWVQLDWIFKSPMVSLRGANFKFDMTWLKLNWGISVTNFKFDTMLVGSLLNENRCVVPSTLLLTDDLRWVKAGEVKVGDNLLGFDEETPIQGGNRRLVQSVALSTKIIQKRCVRIIMSNGQELVVSNNHQFLSDQYGHHNLVWRHAITLKSGDRIKMVVPSPYDLGKASDFDKGRMSGFLDGEGSSHKVGKTGAWAVTWGQKPGIVQDDMKNILDELGVGFTEHDDNINVCKTVRTRGSWNNLKLLMLTRPLRLLSKAMWLGSSLAREPYNVTVVSVEDVGVCDVVALETSSSTFIAEGFASHNSNSLKLHAKVMTQMGGYEDGMDKYDFGCLERVPKDELLMYAGGDTDVTYQVSQVMKDEILRDKVLSNFYVKLVHPASLAFEKLEQNGVLVDQEYYYQLQQELQFEISRIQKELLECLPNKLRIKYKDDIAASLREGKSPLKPKVLLDYLFTSNGLNLKPKMFTAKTKAPSTAMDHLMMFGDDDVAANFIGLFRELGSASKTLSTFVVGFLKHLRKDGRLHPTYMLHRGDYGSDDSGTTCLSPTTPVFTSMGVLFAKDVEVGMRVLTHSGNWMEVEDKIDNGIKMVCRVVLDSGHHVTCTGNHPFYTEDGWVWASELEEGDKVWVYGDSEVWKVVDLDKRYEVSNWGRVRHVMSSKILSPTKKGKWGHLKVELGHRENRLSIGVHRLVALAFVPNIYGGDQVRHLDGKGWNNVAWNLEWGTTSDNRRDAVNHGTTRRTDSEYAKLDWDMVAYIRSVSGGLGSDAKLAEELGVSRKLVNGVRNGSRWVSKSIERFDYGFTLATVVSVEKVGTMRTWGLQVKGDHSHVTAGIVTHNTGRTSAKDPAIQCMVGGTEVLTNDGLKRLDWLVSMNGNGLRVLTHTGEWRPIVGVYDNGAKKTYNVLLSSGHSVQCTENHPLLTDKGWVRTDRLHLGDTCYVCKGYRVGASDKELYQSDLFQLGSYEESVHVPNFKGLEEVRGERDYCLPTVDGVSEFFEGYGGEASTRLVYREDRCKRELRVSELSVGYEQGADEESSKHKDDRVQGKDSNDGSVGGRIRNQSRKTEVSVRYYQDDNGGGTEEYSNPELRLFEAVQVIAIEEATIEQTYDLTIEGSHSFVANGVVVHNTLPKHSKWAKRLRKAFIAPPGKAILNCVDPSTRVLTSDLRWVMAGTVQEGDCLVGFDEELPAKWTERCLRESVVTHVATKKSPRVKITFESGRVVTVSNDHKWLGCKTVDNGNRQLKFIRSDKLEARIHKVRVVLEPWDEVVQDYDLGYLSGVLDGEGYVNQSSGVTLGIAQAEGVVWDEILRLMWKFGFQGTVDLLDRTHIKESYKNLLQYRVCNMATVMKLLGIVRPKRLLSKSPWVGKNMPRIGFDRVMRVQVIPAGEVVSITTSTRTFVAEGLASHNCDYSQGELRICAVVANEPTMIRAYQDGMDLHALTAAQLSGYEYDEFMALPDDIREELRYGGKAGNFGLIYGMQHRGFREYAYQTYKVNMTDEEAYIKREKFFELYSMLPVWHEKYKGFAHQYQLVRSPLGRIRHLPLIASKDSDMVAQAERQAINSPIQSCLSDMMQLAMVYIQKEYGDQIQMFMMTHDSLSSYVPEDEAALWGGRLKEIMENLPLARDFNWNSPLKFYVDAESGPNLAELKKLKNL